MFDRESDEAKKSKESNAPSLDDESTGDVSLVAASDSWALALAVPAVAPIGPTRLAKLAAARAKCVRAVERSDAPAVGAAGAEPSMAGFAPAFELFERAVAAFEGCVVPADGAVVVEMRRLIGRLEAVLCEAEIRFDASELWRLDGGSSLRNWMTSRAGMSRKEAAAAARRVERLELWPELVEAWRGGVLDGSKVSAVVEGVPSRFTRRFAEDAASVIEIIAPLDADSVSRAIAQWVRCVEAGDGPEHLVERPSGVFLDRLPDGRRVLSGEFTESAGLIIDTAIKDFDVPDPIDENGQLIGEPRTLAQRRADALVAALEFACDHRQGASESGRFLPHVSVIVDVAELRAAALAGAGVRDAASLEAFAEAHSCGPVERGLYAEALGRRGAAVTHEGVEIGAGAVAHISCDSVVHRMMVSGDEVLQMGRSVRSATAKQRRALIARDRHCRAPGCRTSVKHCDAHHLVHWAAGGATDLSNLVLLCGTHHRQFHEPGHRMELDPVTAEFTVHSPRGWSRSSTPEKLEADLLGGESFER